ncbi:trypsin-like peptidase domain-containing protein [Microbacterium sp. Leaf179]|uniref:trypsin-like peptidase domain-containing protein n=1 Tax=Microbacterium sp. Leaf179 TaxID=1736288 RepID=UPI000A9CF6DA|nr:trypsin-like peptidase domain-containing protein [Microbacterium sp. Leaf179]
MSGISVEVRAGADVLGAGFFILSDIVATARHCLQDQLPEEPLSVKTEDGDVFAASVLSMVEEKDLALLQVSLPDTDVVSRASLPALPYLEAQWRSPYIPALDQVSIRGSIVHLHPQFACAYGGQLRASQLEARPSLDSYEGYSGSVIQLKTLTGPPVGMIIQEGHGAGSRETLFAADMREFVEAFDVLSDINVLDAELETHLSELGASVAREFGERFVVSGRAGGVLPGRIEAIVIQAIRRELNGQNDE